MSVNDIKRKRGIMSSTENSPENTTKRPTTQRNNYMSGEHCFTAILKEINDKLNQMATKEDIKSLIKDVTKLKNTCNSLNEEMESSRKREEILEQRIEKLEMQIKRKNIIVHGLHSATINDAINEIKLIYKDVMGIKTSSIEKITNIFFIGNQKENKTLLMEIPNYEINKEIFNNAKKLKGTNISIQRDLPYNVRKRRANLRKYAAKIKEVNQSLNVIIKGDAICIDDEKFIWNTNLNKLMCGENDALKIK